MIDVSAYGVKTVIIVDDQDVLRFSLRSQLSYSSQYMLVGEARNGVEAVQLAQQKKPDIILMDIKMPELSGVEATKQIKAEFPATTVLMFTGDEDEAMVQCALSAGATGYCIKGISREDLMEAMQSTLNGETWLDPKLESMSSAAAS